MQPTSTLEIALTQICPHVCTTCPQKVLINSYKRDGYNELSFKNNLGYMNFEEYKEILKKVPTHVWIDWSATVDPSHHPLVADFVEHTYKTHKYQRFYSTLAGLSIDSINRITKIPFINVTIHLPDNQGMLKQDVNEEYIGKIDLFTTLYKANGICFGKIHPKLEHFKNKFIINEQSTTTPSDLISRAGSVVESSLIKLKPVIRNGPVICSSVINKRGPIKYSLNWLDVDFNLIMCCCIWNRSPEYTFGNLKTQSYESCFESDEYKEIIRKSQSGDKSLACYKCELSQEHTWEV